MTYLKIMMKLDLKEPKPYPCKPKESLPPREDSSEHWKNEDYAKVQLLENLNEMQYEGNQQSGQAEASLLGKLDDGRSPESREMCIDMELSTPINSTFDCTDLQSLLEDKPYENFEAPEMEARGEGLRDIRPSSSGNDLKFGTEYEGSQTSHIESRYGLVNEETFISGTHHHTNLGFNLWPRNVEDQFHVYKNDTTAGLHPEYNLNELEKQRRETTNTGAHLPLYGQQQGHNSLSGGGILPYQYSEFFQVGSLPSDPCGHVGYVANNAALCTQTGSVDARMSTQTTFVSLAENYTAPAP
ncbi:hypothetical protein L1049_023666 [Liquidambar formosana]|uniref:Uncharacterized protein n=1 Tax=Liquidambar formosana TaxID=63359 RepID=A0AAP0RT75_LIQFO